MLTGCLDGRTGCLDGFTGCLDGFTGCLDGLVEEPVNAPARTMHPHPDRGSGTSQDFGRLGDRQSLPCEEFQDLALVGLEALQRRRRRHTRVDFVGRIVRYRIGFASEANLQRVRAAASTTLVREDPPRDSEEPRERGIRDHVASSPGHGEGLGHDLLRRVRIAPAHGVGEHGIGMPVKERLETAEGRSVRLIA
jgi:hypothetical protein